MLFKKLRDFFAAQPPTRVVKEAESTPLGVPEAADAPPELIAPSDLVQNHLVRQQLLAEIERTLGRVENRL